MTCKLVGTMIMLGFLALAWGCLEMRSVILRKAGAQAAAKRGTERKRRAIRWSRDSHRSGSVVAALGAAMDVADRDLRGYCRIPACGAATGDHGYVGERWARHFDAPTDA